jgi:FAD/FMN-containing dehydrogenase
MSGRMDPGYADLLRRVKELLDPAGIMNPGRLGL